MNEKIICVDFDNCIVTELPKFDKDKVGHLFPKVKESLEKLKSLGFQIIIFTVRDHTEPVKQLLDENEIPYDKINERIAEFSQSPKPYADYYIDDRGLRFQGDWDATIKFVEQDLLFQAGKADKPMFASKWHTIKSDENGYQYTEGIKGIAVLPYRKNGEITQFLIRDENNPMVENNELVTVITGRIDEGETLAQSCVRELKEEGGYVIQENQLENLGRIYIGKSSPIPDELYTVDLTGLEEGEITTDGTHYEANSSNRWVDESEIDLIVANATDTYLLAILKKFDVYANTTIKEAKARSYSCLMVTDVPKELKNEIKNIQKKIPEDLLIAQGDGTENGNSTSTGIEKLHHITVLYGLTVDDKAEIKKIYNETKKNFKLKNSKEISYFDSDKETVAKIEIIVPEALKNFRKNIFSNIENQDNYSDWKPHMTIAYLKPGTRLPFDIEQIEWSIKELAFSDHNEAISKVAMFKPTEELEQFIQIEFIQDLIKPLTHQAEEEKDIFDFVKFGKEDHLAYYDKNEKSIVFDYDSFHNLVEEDKEKLFKVLAHELTHMMQDFENRLVIPEEDIVENYFENESEGEALNNEIRFFKSIGYTSPKIKKIFENSFSRFGKTYTEELKDKLTQRIEEVD
jgi:ADP-ribose pyrophosphatase YjhB (NUDIX family)/2'-5' RNA ligase